MPEPVDDEEYKRAMIRMARITEEESERKKKNVKRWEWILAALIIIYALGQFLVGYAGAIGAGEHPWPF